MEKKVTIGKLGIIYIYKCACEKDMVYKGDKDNIRGTEYDGRYRLYE